MANIIGQAPSFRKAIEHLPEISRSRSAVLVGGESGTGKELIARAIHYLSPRAASAFVAINCGAYPETLFESELFGHERGAFTGAQGRREGLLAHANGGTLFLDEVDSLPPKAQSNLLRVLQEKGFRALGSNLERHSDVRFVAATNAPLARLMDTGQFRSDLFYRLCVFQIGLPALRERREDILPLAEHFIRKHAPACSKIPVFTPEARESLSAYNWPGNVRELENAVIRGVCLACSNEIGIDDLGLPAAPPGSGPSRNSYRAAKKEAMAVFERNYVERLLSEHSGNISSAARAAQKDRRDFGRLVKKHQLHMNQYSVRSQTA